MGSVAIGDLLEWASAAVFLTIAVLAVRRVSDVPLARPLVFFALGLFAYVVVVQATPGDASMFLNGVENGIASLIFIPAVELLLGFAGRRRDLERFLYSSYAYYGLLALFCVSPFYDKGKWEALMFGGLLLFFGYAAIVLVQHYRRSGSVERVRTLLLLGALLLGGVGTASTLLHDDYGTPDLVDTGMMATGVLLAALFFRTKLLRGTTNLSIVTAAVFATVVVVGEIILYSARAETPAVFVSGSILIVLFAFAALRPIFGAVSSERARAEQLATLGRLSQQMAHDVKNPLAAIEGAAEFLLEERKQGRSLDDSADFVELILAQAQRIEAVIADYRRLSRVEPQRVTTSLKALIEEIAAAQKLAPHARELDLRAEVAPDVGEGRVDPELLRTALENLVRNASEAMAEAGRGGTIVIRATRAHGGLCVAVEDDGPGMDARTEAQALGDFFTTKASGSGLGLPFARRVAEAHGGELLLDSREGEGTTVKLILATD